MAQMFIFGGDFENRIIKLCHKFLWHLDYNSKSVSLHRLWNPGGNALQRHFFYRYGIQTCCYLPAVFRGPKWLNTASPYESHPSSDTTRYCTPTSSPSYKAIQPSSLHNITSEHVCCCISVGVITTKRVFSFRQTFRPVDTGAKSVATLSKYAAANVSSAALLYNYFRFQSLFKHSNNNRISHHLGKQTFASQADIRWNAYNRGMIQIARKAGQVDPYETNRSASTAERAAVASASIRWPLLGHRRIRLCFEVRNGNCGRK